MGTNKSGRPSTYNNKLHPLIFELLARLGYTDKGAAKKLGISEKTYTNWKSKYSKELLPSIKRGKDSIDDQVESALCKRALGFEKEAVKLFQYQGKVIKEKYDEYYPPDVAACFIWLKNRRPEKWRDKKDVNVSGGFDVMKFDVPISKEEEEEARKQLRLFLKKGFDPEEDYTNGQ